MVELSIGNQEAQLKVICDKIDFFKQMILTKVKTSDPQIQFDEAVG